jgi:hypothetical protein
MSTGRFFLFLEVSSQFHCRKQEIGRFAEGNCCKEEKEDYSSYEKEEEGRKSYFF